MKKRLLLVFWSLFLAPSLLIFGQGEAGKFSMSGTLRPRYEFRDGYSSLLQPSDEASQFISQRTRLDLNYLKNKQFNIFISVQDVRVWGDTKQLTKGENNQFSLHQAWGELWATPLISIKAGRQELVYDDHRILGNVDWAQQGRSHDALLVKYQKEAWKAHLGLAYNNQQESNSKQAYTTSNYKSMQFFWGNYSAEKWQLSLLALNNGIELMSSPDLDVNYSQTFGFYGLLNPCSGLKLHASAYMQTGKDAADRDLSAWYAAFSANMKINDEFSATLGAELLSGNSTDTQADENNAFTPLYGTNHKFNGHMDYFYVGNHMNSYGLNDLYATLNYKKDKWSCFLTGHYFAANGDMGSNLDQYLGFELDLGLKYTVSKEVSIAAGYSHMIASENMEALKGLAGQDPNRNANWAYLMLVFRPQFF